MVEQNASIAIGMAHRAYVWEDGKISVEGRKGSDFLGSARRGDRKR